LPEQAVEHEELVADTAGHDHGMEARILVADEIVVADAAAAAEVWVWGRVSAPARHDEAEAIGGGNVTLAPEFG